MLKKNLMFSFILWQLKTFNKILNNKNYCIIYVFEFSLLL